MRSSCLMNMCLSFFLILCCSITVQSYYLLARYEPDTLMQQWLETLRLRNEQENVDNVERPQLQMPLLSNQRSTQQKRSAANTKPLPPHEHVCEMKIRQNYQPKFGHEQNGTRVEIQQDENRTFRATFVECEDPNRAACHGIDGLFSSECITVYGLQPAGIRIEGSAGDFNEGLIKVPVACQCRLRRKTGHLVLADE